MNFLQQMEQKRVKDCEELELRRKKERDDDKKELLGMFKNMISENVSTLVTRTELVEKENKDLKSKVDSPIEDMNTVKQHIFKEKQPSVSEPSAGPKFFCDQPDTADLTQSNQDQLKSIISMARRTVGLQRIDQQDLIRMRQAQYGGARSAEEEKLFAVREFLECEVKLPKDTIELMKVEKIFSPALQSNPQWLYVTFEDESSIQKIFGKTRIMRKESRIITYIPREFHSRFVALRDLSYTIRHEEDCKTRIKMGFNDLHLDKKDKNTGRWIRVKVDFELPAIDLSRSPLKEPSNSPAPGRPEQNRQSKRGRESTGSDSNNTPKVSKVDVTDNKIQAQDKSVSVDSFEKRLRDADLVSEIVEDPAEKCHGKLDHGNVVSITSTPLGKSISSQSSESPVFKKTNHKQN